MSNRQDFKKRPRVRQGGPMGGMGAGEKAKNFRGTMKKLVCYLAAFRWRLLAVAVLAVGSTIFAIVSPKILGEATNQIVKDYVSIKAYDTITKKLPADTKLPSGTTGGDILNRLPNKSEIEGKIPAARLI